MSTHIEDARKRKSGERIKELRKELNLTQEQLSDIIGRERSEISKWERGNGTISTETYWRLYDAFRSLEISMDYLMGVKDVRKPQNESIVKELHLSEQSIETIRYECSEKGDNSRIVILDYILSNHDFFANLMSEMHSLISPTYILVDRKRLPSAYAVHKPDGSIDENYMMITPEVIRQLSENIPEFIYPRMRLLVEDFLKTVPDTMIAPNEFNPITGYYEDEEEEE